jgi:hypothetical protein
MGADNSLQEEGDTRRSGRDVGDLKENRTLVLCPSKHYRGITHRLFHDTV